MVLEITVTSVKIGDRWVTVAFKNGMLLANSIPSEDRDSSRSSVFASLKERGEDASGVREAETTKGRELAEMVEGSARSAPNPSVISFDGMTPFRKAVLERVLEIPAGKVASYRDVAAAAGRPKAYRAVGNIMASNPFPYIIPCHRVVKSDLSIGGYGTNPGMKAKFLKEEGVSVEDGRVKAKHRLAQGK